jgi:hypothetical protein
MNGRKLDSTTEEGMKALCIASAALVALFVAAYPSRAQDTPRPDSKKPPVTLKVQATITETEGEKKLGNLPYTFFVRVAEPGTVPAWTKMRIGSRVPVYTGKDNGMQYIDVGMNIDTRGTIEEDGRFDLYFQLERSWVEGDVSVLMDKTATASDATAARFKEPIIRQFKTELNLSLHDGQTIQTTQAADPLSGRILSVTITINVVK